MKMRLLPVPLLLILASLSAAQVAPRYTLTRVSPPGLTGFAGLGGLTDSGFLAASSSARGFGWTVGLQGGPSASHVFPPPPGVDWAVSAATAINASGVAVGLFDTVAFSFPLSRGFRNLGSATVELLGPEGTPGLPAAINRDGWIVGSTTTTSGPRAVLWSPALVASYLTPLTQAQDINDAGVVLGSLGTGSSERAAILTGGVLTELGDLDPLADPSVRGVALNNLGHVVGETLLGGRGVAFRWSSAGGMTQLPPLPGPLGADRVYDINDSGWAVGFAWEGATPQAVVWAPDGAITRLGERYPPVPDPSVLQLNAGYRINSAGQIAGSGSRHFQVAAVIFTPAELDAVALAPAVAGAPYTVNVSGVGPGKLAFLVGDLYDPEERGYRALPGGPLGVSMSTPHIVARATADASGRARLVWNVPQSLAGLSLRLQVFQRRPTRVSKLLRETP